MGTLYHELSVTAILIVNIHVVVFCIYLSNIQRIDLKTLTFNRKVFD